MTRQPFCGYTCGMKIIINGGGSLFGEVHPSGSKNSIVALIPATVLFNTEVTLTNVPDITDVRTLVHILELLNSKVVWDKTHSTLKIDNSHIENKPLTQEMLGNMRGVSLLWGALLGRFGECTFESLPGGCTLGERSFTPHFEALKLLGVEVTEDKHGVKMKVTGKPMQKLWFSEMSPTVTENFLLLASSFRIKVHAIGAASEPHVQDLCNFLTKAGCKISGVGSSVLEVCGPGKFSTPISHAVISDHYEIGTFLALAAVTRGELKIHNSLPQHFDLINRVFAQFGFNITYSGDTAMLSFKNREIVVHDKTLSIKAQPWPGIPVDMLPLFIPLALAAESGAYLFHNWMYERGLFWTEQLEKLGANITVCDPHRVLVSGGKKLKGASLTAPNIIRAVIAMVMACLTAEGESVISNADALLRAHPDFVGNLKSLGADISAVD